MTCEFLHFSQKQRKIAKYEAIYRMQTPNGEFSILFFTLLPKNDNQLPELSWSDKFPSGNIPEGEDVVDIHSTNAYFGRISAKILFPEHKWLPMSFFNLVAHNMTIGAQLIPQFALGKLSVATLCMLRFFGWYILIWWSFGA